MRLPACVVIALFAGACHGERGAPVARPSAPGAAPVAVSSKPAAQEQSCTALPADHNVLYERGIRLIRPYLRLLDHAGAGGVTREQDLNEGIACLDGALKLFPSNWAALWFRGKAYQSLRHHDRARDSFRSAYEIHPQNVDVGRELVIECLELGLTKEAVRVAEKTLGTSPDSADLRANLALALLLDGQVDRAKKEVSDAAAQDPGDPITRALQSRIDAVVRGVRPPPRSLDDLERADGP